MKKYMHYLLSLLLHKVTQGLSLALSRTAAITADLSRPVLSFEL